MCKKFLAKIWKAPQMAGLLCRKRRSTAVNGRWGRDCWQRKGIDAERADAKGFTSRLRLDNASFWLWLAQLIQSAAARLGSSHPRACQPLRRPLRLYALPAAPNAGPFPLRTVCCERILPLGVITSALASRSGIMQRYIYMSFFGIGKTQEAFGSIGEACA